MAMRVVHCVKRSLRRIAGRRNNVSILALTSPHSPVPDPGESWVRDPVALQAVPALVDRFVEELASHSVDYWVGVFGYVSPRKNLHLIAEAITPLPGVGLVLAGTVSDEAEKLARPWLETLMSEGRVYVHRGPLASDMFDSLLSSVDCVVAAHSNDGPSGVVARAAVAGKVVVLAGAPTLRREAIALGPQAFWAELTVCGLRMAVAEARDEPRPFTPPVGGVEHFVSRLLGPPTSP
ncbi:glycosyltransferase involved in cell wall biosynthesis [Yonghaparkia alkaliphila]|uniref:Glycosyltransferase involved in cell wall biosynthesis n=1 Tax=Microcella alkalica TaxID=355930 RepID=A0A839ECH8_9MICO|nr:glycosyltransferase involved in cell wall biosynthesis [Microcella alkalica]